MHPARYLLLLHQLKTSPAHCRPRTYCKQRTSSARHISPHRLRQMAQLMSAQQQMSHTRLTSSLNQLRRHIRRLAMLRPPTLPPCCRRLYLRLLTSPPHHPHCLPRTLCRPQTASARLIWRSRHSQVQQTMLTRLAPSLNRLVPQMYRLALFQLHSLRRCNHQVSV